MINGPIIRTKAQRLQELCNVSLPANQHLTMQFSEGWRANFKRQWGLKSLKAHGESGDADHKAMHAWLPAITARIAAYEFRDVFNADECGLLYKLAPDNTVAITRPSGRKKMKDRITVLVCTNPDGSVKFDLMFIGTAQRPRPFKKKNGIDYGLDYHTNKKAWMTGKVFTSWWNRFNAYFGILNRHVLLLIDNCSARGTLSVLPPLNNVEVMFIPPNTTSKLQPCDAGIIAAMKVHYRTLQMKRALDLVEEGSVLDIYKVDTLSAMLAFKKNWKSLPMSTIANFWGHTRLLGNENSPVGVQGSPSHGEELENLQSLLHQLVPTTSRIDIVALLNPDCEDDCIQEVSDSNLVEKVLGNDIYDNEDCNGEDSNERMALPSFKKQLAALALCKRMYDVYDVPDGIRGQLALLQRIVRLERSNAIQQTTMDHVLQ